MSTENLDPRAVICQMASPNHPSYNYFDDSKLSLLCQCYLCVVSRLRRFYPNDKIFIGPKFPNSDEDIAYTRRLPIWRIPGGKGDSPNPFVLDTEALELTFRELAEDRKEGEV